MRPYPTAQSVDTHLPPFINTLGPFSKSFQKELQNTSQAQEYLVGRGVTPDDIEAWSLGYDHRGDRITILWG
jgi:DNA primase